MSSATTAVARIAISSSAIPGPRTVTVRTLLQVESLDSGFTVAAAGTPVLTLVNPTSGQQGTASLNVALTGQFTNFAKGTSVASFGGAGVTVNTTTVTDATHATANVTIGATATPGARTVTMTTGAEVVSLANGFMVTAGTPVLTLVSPNSGQQGTVSLNIALTGQFTNFVNGTSVASFGGAGVTVNTTTVTDATHATANVTIGATATLGARTVTMTTGAEVVSLATGFTVTAASPPVITDFAPKSSPVGTLITVTGSNLAPSPQVALNKRGGGSVSAPVSGASGTSLSFVIPTGAATGPITVTVGTQSAASAAALTVTSTADFQVGVAPSSVDVIAGQSTTLAVTLTSANGFSQLAQLSAAGVPAGVTGTFKPTQISGGQTSVLTLVAPAGQSTGASTITVTANATVDGLPLSHSGTATLNVRPVTTSFLGRTVVDDPLQTPLAGISIFMLGRNGSGQTTGCVGQTVSDAAGNFALTDLPASCVGDQLIAYDGSTATSPPGVYAGVNLAYTIVANQVTVSPVLVHLPRIDDNETFLVRQNSPTDQTFTFRTIPNLSATVYAGTTFTLPGGSRPDPFPLIAVQVPVDRLPDTMPPMLNAVDAFIVAFQPANTTASQAVAVSFPNTLNSPVGATLELTTLDPTKGVMVIYGTGQVSPSGLQVIPDFNPATPGKRYGITNFDWHGPMFQPQPAINPVPSNSTCPGSDVPGGLTADTKAPTCGKPIDVGTGLEMYSITDLSFGDLRGTVSLQRTYRTLSNLAGPFGIGTGHNYGYAIDTAFPQAGAQFRLILPEGGRIPFAPQPDGTFTNTTAPVLRGMVAHIQQDGRVALRLKDGTTYRFVTGLGALGFSPLESLADSNGNVTTLIRDVSNPVRITSITDPVGRSLTLAYDSNNRITSAADPIGRTVGYTYNSQGTLETVTDPEGGVTRYEYDVQNRLNQVTDARGVVVAQNTFDANGRVIEQVQADGGRLQFEYTLFNPIAPTGPVQQTVVTDPFGNRTTYRFNPEGYLVDVTDASGQRHLIGREQGTNLVQVVAHGSSCAPANWPEVTSLPRCTTADPSGPITSFTYDANGNVLTVRDPLAQLTRFEYGGQFNKVTRITDALANVTRFEYDALGNLTRTIDAKGNATQYAYDLHGLLTAVTDPLHQTTNLAYDDFANLVSITNALGQVTTLRYDGIGRILEVRDPVGRTSSTAYDALDRIVSETNGNKEVTRFAYDAIGNVLSLTDARNNATQFTYDGMSRLLTHTDPLAHTDSRTYDRNGNLTEFVDRRGQTSSFAYDAMNRLTRETYQDSTVDRSYDLVGRLASVEDSIGGGFAFTYDQAGRQTSAAGPFGTVRYTRDALGQVTSRQVVGQDAQTHTYDPVGNLVTSATPQANVTFSYNARNEVQSLGRANGVNTSYSYDAVGRVLSIVHASASGTLASLQYTYDASGKRVSQTSTTAQPLITQAAQQSFNNANQLLRSGGTTYTYDENGNRLTETGPSGTTTYRWDSRNRLVSIAAPGGQTTTFLFDFAGNLLSQRDTGPTTNRVQEFVLDEITNVAHVSDSAIGHYSFLTADGIDTHLATSGSTGTLYALTDALNSTVATTDALGGSQSTLFYDPYGRTVVSGPGYPFQFGGRNSVGGNLYHYRARFYDTAAARFLSEDPIGFAGRDTNLYRYVHNHPLDRVDPRGLYDPAQEQIDEAVAYVKKPLKQMASLSQRVPFVVAFDTSGLVITGVAAILCVYSGVCETVAAGLIVGEIVAGLFELAQFGNSVCNIAEPVQKRSKAELKIVLDPRR